MKKAIRCFAILLILTVVSVCFTACNVVAESLVLSHTELSINLGNATAVTCTVLPENTTNKTVVWNSSDDAIATISDVGVITTVSVGTCTITATVGEVSAEINVTVKKPVDQLILNQTDVTMKQEDSFTFECTILPHDASIQTITWTSSDSSVAMVNEKGEITGKKPGNCVITATVDGKSAIANITVKEKGPDFKKLYKDIASDAVYGWEVGSDGSYLSADTNVFDLDDFNNKSIWNSIKAMNRKLGLPSSLDNDMESTTALMGKQSRTFESAGVEVFWTYHPDKGMEVTYQLLDE